MSRINVDIASKEELQRVPGIGPKIAEAIISMRELTGGITKSQFASIPHVRCTPELWSMLCFPSEPSDDEAQDRDEFTDGLRELASTNLYPSDEEPQAQAFAMPSEDEPTELDTRADTLLESDYSGRKAVKGEPAEDTIARLTEVIDRAGLRGPSPGPMDTGKKWRGKGHSKYQTASHSKLGGARPKEEISHELSGPSPRDTQTPQAHIPSYPYPMAPAGVTPGYGSPYVPYPMPGMWPWVYPQAFGGSMGVPAMSTGRQPVSSTGRLEGGSEAQRDSSMVRDRSSKTKLQQLPKTLQYDGNSSWQAFHSKFRKYAGILEWSEAEKRDYLCLCLTDKASEFYALNTDKQEVTYAEMVEKLEKRFGFRELPETAMVNFSGAQQGADETLDDWADRVLTIAGKAFRELPDQFMVNQSILRFCTGAREKEAGEQVINKKPATMEEALDKMKWAIHTHNMVYGKSRSIRKVEARETPAVSEVRTTAGINQSNAGQGSNKDRMDKLEARMGRLEDKVDKLEEALTRSFEKFERMISRISRRPSVSPSRDNKEATCYGCHQQGHLKRDCPQLRSRSPSPNRLGGVVCYACNEKGHYKNECPRNNERSGVGNKKVSFVDLNDSGSD